MHSFLEQDTNCIRTTEAIIKIINSLKVQYNLPRLETYIKTIKFMFAGINMFWALLRVVFKPKLQGRVKTQTCSCSIT